MDGYVQEKLSRFMKIGNEGVKIDQGCKGEEDGEREKEKEG